MQGEGRQRGPRSDGEAARVRGRARSIPTLLRIHGGPNGQDAHSFNFERQFFAANGYVVLAVNYRGSSGRGEEYQVAITADWGNKEVVDLQAAVDHAIATGVADPERLGVGGWSYGGILTERSLPRTAIQGRHQRRGHGPSAGLLRRGPVHHAVRLRNRPAVEGLAWEPWNKISYAFLHADQIKTPTLFLGGEKDFNVPLAGRRTDVSGAAQPWGADSASGVSGSVPRNHPAELPEGPHGAVSRLVSEISQVT